MEVNLKNQRATYLQGRGFYLQRTKFVEKGAVFAHVNEPIRQKIVPYKRMLFQLHAMDVIFSCLQLPRLLSAEKDYILSNKTQACSKQKECTHLNPDCTFSLNFAFFSSLILEGFLGSTILFFYCT